MARDGSRDDYQRPPAHRIHDQGFPQFTYRRSDVQRVDSKKDELAALLRRELEHLSSPSVADLQHRIEELCDRVLPKRGSLRSTTMAAFWWTGEGLPEREKTVGKGPKKRNVAPAGGHHPGTEAKLCPNKNATETGNSGCESKGMGPAAFFTKSTKRTNSWIQFVKKDYLPNNSETRWNFKSRVVNALFD
jgi:hypothetical protein